MSTIDVILEVDADGTLHLPVPEELRRGKVRVEAKLEAAAQAPLDGDSEKSSTPLAAFETLRNLGGLRRFIPDPVAWQCELRKD